MYRWWSEVVVGVRQLLGQASVVGGCVPEPPCSGQR